MSDDYEQVTVTTRAQWRRWLAGHHDTSPGIWLVRYKQDSGRKHVTYDDVVDEALCFGWVDSRPRALDEERSQLLLTPRKPKSRWSAVNKDRVARLTREGLMQPSGIASVEAAKRNGSWDALDAVEQLVEPQDLAKALDKEPTARAEWDGFPRSTKRAILEWITSAKTPETRQRRISETVSEAKIGRRANQWRQPKGR
jgi:uncharacterized protein YdeI (YjbR/CyaY-like superfamily)